MFGIFSLGDPSTETLAVDTICIFKIRALEIGNRELYNAEVKDVRVLFHKRLYRRLYKQYLGVSL